MQCMRLLVVLCSVGTAAASDVTPIGKVLQMLSDLQAKVIKEGESAQKMYEEYSEWCEDRSSTLGNDIKTGQSETKTLQATHAQESAFIAAGNEKVQDLASSIAIDQADLKAATHIRASEESAFASSQKELMETVDMLQRAVTILEQEMKGGASMMQLQNAHSLTQALAVLVQASMVSSADAGKLTALLQSSSGDDSEDVGAPAGAVYDSHSADIVETLSNLLEKAEEQLSSLRNKETEDINAFQMIKQSLVDELAYGTKEMAETKKNLASSSEGKATAEGDLAITSKELSADVTAKADLHHACMTKAEEFEAETNSRGEELKALAEAKKVIKDSTVGANAIKYSSFVQISSTSTSSYLQAIRIVRDVAHRQESPILSQLAQRLDAVAHNNGASADQFAKIKGLIRDMLDKLEAEADVDATEKAWCDRNLADTRQSKSDKTNEIAKTNTRIEAMAAKSEQLKQEIAALQGSLAKLAKAQHDMDTMRAAEHAAFVTSKADMEQGLEGVKLALKILSDYYSTEDKAHAAAMGSGDGIIGLLEVIESDFSKSLAEIITSEESAGESFDQETKENDIEKTTKDQDVKYKTKESKRLDESIAELSTDRSTVQTELDAVNEYLSKLEGRCVAKAETYAARKARFAAELAGLKEALRVLESETALLQRKSWKRSLRAGYMHP